MANFADGIQFHTLHCANCGLPFAITSDFESRRREDHKVFYCPSGHENYYNGKSEKQKLKEQLDAKTEELSRALGRANRAEHDRERVKKTYKRMRKRVANGVCPCCNRTFQNLLNHMKTEHPEFDKPQSLKAVRTAFGMTQSDLAREVGLHPSSISLFECGKTVPGHVNKTLEAWLDRQTGAA